MNKNIKRVFAGLAGVLALLVALAWWLPGGSLVGKKCAFCDQKVLQTHTFYEDDLVRGLCSYKPVMPGHCLIVPKRHIERIEDATDQEFLAIGRLVKKINRVIQKINGRSAYMLMQKNGMEVGQSVPHVHVHYVPVCQTGSKYTVYYVWLRYFFNIFRVKLTDDELAEWVGKMRKEIDNMKEEI